MRKHIHEFLTYCVQSQQYKKTELPPEGGFVAVFAERIGLPLTDSQILRLIEALPDMTIGDLWRFSFLLMTTYGLRQANPISTKFTTTLPYSFCLQKV